MNRQFLFLCLGSTAGWAANKGWGFVRCKWAQEAHCSPRGARKGESCLLVRPRRYTARTHSLKKHNSSSIKTNGYFVKAEVWITARDSFCVPSYVHTPTHIYVSHFLVSFSRWFTGKLYHLAQWCRLQGAIARFIWPDRVAISRIIDGQPIIQG